MTILACCCQKNVLLWCANSNAGCGGGGDSPFNQLQIFKNLYLNLGATVHFVPAFTGNLHDYFLVIWPQAIEDPTWWGTVTGGTWRGRLHITAEHGGPCDGTAGTQVTIDYVNSISSVIGASIVCANHAGGTTNQGTAESDDLTAGQSTMRYTATSEVSGGTTLSKTHSSEGSAPWLTRTKPSGQDTEFVVCGDTNHYLTHFTHNTPFFQNLYTVALL